MWILEWLNKYFLKMEWLYNLVTVVLEDVLGLNSANLWFTFLHFFIYDFIKILLLLIGFVFLTSYLITYIQPSKTHHMLERITGVKANIFAAGLGAVTQLCSCASVPVFIGLLQTGVPLGVAFSFLIVSPMLDITSLIIIAAIFNWKIAAIYFMAAMTLAVVGGIIISKLNLKNQIESFVYENNYIEYIYTRLTFKKRIAYAKKRVKDVLQKVALFLIVDVFIAAAIFVFIPKNMIIDLFGQDKFYSVPLALVFGLPLYADIFTTLPIAEVLYEKGAGLGTAVAFTMGVTALSLPSVIMLKNVSKMKLLYIYTTILAVGILIIGYFLNFFAFMLL